MSSSLYAGSASLLLRTLSAALLAGGLLTACGGGGSSSSSTTSYVTGIVATGAPLQGATAQTGVLVTLTDLNGKQASTTSDPTTGAYTINVTGLTLPFVVRASGMSGDALVDLTSMVSATGTATGQIFQANLTPLGNAIAAMLAKADPITLTPAQVQAAIPSTTASPGIITGYVMATLANSLTYGGYNPLTTAFSANDSGYDATLDNLAVVTSHSSNSVTLFDKYAWPSTNLTAAATSTAAATTAVDDTGELASLPTSPVLVNATPVTLTANSDYTLAATALDLTAIALPANNLAGFLTSTLEPALNNCFKSTSPSAGTCSSLAGQFSTGSTSTATTAAAAGTVIPAYLNNGSNAAGFYGNFVATDTYVFDQPSVVRYVNPTEAIVHTSWTRSDGIRGHFETLAVYNSHNTWQLVGNQHQFVASIQPVAEYRKDLGSATTAVNTLNAYTVGLDIKVQNAANIMWAKVTGQGLGSGVQLMPQSGCSDLTPAPNSTCDSYVRLDGIALDKKSAITWPASNPNYGPTPSAVSNISLFQPYVFQIHYCSGILTGSTCSVTPTDVYYVERLSTPLPTISQAVALDYPTPGAAIDTALNGGFNGGTAFPVTWGYPAGNHAPLVDSLYVQTTGSDCAVTRGSMQVPIGTSFNFTTFVRNPSATASVFASFGNFPAANLVTGCVGGLNLVKIDSHRKDGLQVRSVIEYANY